MARQPAGQPRRVETAEKLRAIADLDLEELQAIEIPRGYDRD